MLSSWNPLSIVRIIQIQINSDINSESSRGETTGLVTAVHLTQNTSHLHNIHIIIDTWHIGTHHAPLNLTKNGLGILPLPETVRGDVNGYTPTVVDEI